MDAHFQIRPARSADAADFARLERECFADPWSETSFREALASPWAFALAAETVEGDLIGYLLGRDIAGSGEVLNLAVAPAARRQGLARALLMRALEWFDGRAAAEVYLEVRTSNGAALRLYQAAGFQPVGRRARYYRNPTEDALVLRLALPARA